MPSFTSYVKADSRLYATVSFSIKEKSYDVSTNTSVVEYSFSGSQVSPSYFAFSGTSRNPAGKVVVKINGSDVKSANIALLRYAQGTCSGSGTVTVPHNNDGTKTVSWSIRMDEVTGNYSGDTWKYGATSTSGSLKLTDIPRATTPTLSKTSADMGTSIAINTTPAVSTFTHNIYYKYDGGSWTTIGTSQSGDTTFSIPLSLASQVPNGTSLPLTISCETYNDGTLIGIKQVSFTSTVPSSVVPSISSITVSEAGSVPSSFGCYVKSKSKLKIVTSASGSYSSTITNCTVEYLGSVYSGSSITTGVVNSSGSTSIKVTVTDSRGRKASSTKAVTIVDYATPSLWNISVNRAKSDGTIADDGICANITYAYSISSVNSKNAKSFKIEWSSDNSSWTTLLSESNYSADSSTTSTTVFDSDSKFYFRFKLADSFSTTTKTLLLTETYSLMEYHAGGKGIGFFGKPSKGNDTMEVFGKVEVEDSVQAPKIIGGYYQHHINSDGSSGYFNIAQINIIRTYFNYPIEFTIARRNDTMPTRISIRFQNAGNLEPTLNSFITDGYTNDVYIVKSSTSVWNLYVKKSEAWDSIAILDCKFNREYCGDCVTYKSSQATSLPSGYKQASSKVFVEDTGWIDCTITNSSVSRYANSVDNAPLQVRRIGKIVHLRGCLKNSAVIADATDLAKLPSGFEPTYTEVYVEQGSGTNRFCMRVKSTGVISVERYSNGKSATSIPTGSWINIFATWFID